MPGGYYASQADAVQSAVEAWAGDRPPSCPWRVFWDPFVARVMTAWRWYEKGQLALRIPRPSHRLLEGVQHYDRALELVGARVMEAEQERARQAARAAGAQRG